MKKEETLSDGKSSNSFTSILVRAVILAFLYPILNSLWEGWSAFAGKFPGQGIVPYLSSALAFFATFALLGWVLGTAPVRWFKKGIAKLWSYFILKRLSALEEGTSGENYRGKWVAYALSGRFGDRERARAWVYGLVMAEHGENIAVLLFFPPAGTSALINTTKRGGLVWKTGKPFKKHVENFITFGNSIDPESFLPEEGQP